MRHPATKIVLAALAAVLIVLDRWAWAAVSQWHNDQAISLWLGYTRGLLDMPVGLLTTQGVPNPNGMFAMAYFLSRLPNLWFVSTFLGTVQGGLVIWVCRSAFPFSNRLFYVASAPVLVSVILGASSVEFWPQYCMTFVDLFFLIWCLSYMSKPSIWKLPLLAVLVCWAPAQYLAGVVNAVAMTVMGLGILLLRRPVESKRSLAGALVASLLVVSISVWITWWPYFRNVSLEDLQALHPYWQPNAVQTLAAGVLSFLSFPMYASVQWAYLTFLNNSKEILSGPAILFNQATIWTGVAQGVLALTAIVFGLRANWSGRGGWRAAISSADKAVLRIVGVSAGFIVLCYTLSPLIRGPLWAAGQRADQLIQFLPLFMLISFLGPFLFRFPVRLGKVVSALAYSVTGIYVVVNIVAGFFIVRSHLDYRGSVLLISDQDVPIVQKMQAVDFIVADWRTRSHSNVIPVDYRLDGGIWGWITEGGAAMERWYPAPMTLGRSLDYDLLRRYGLWNAQEGIQLRTFGTGRYLVTYAFEPAPEIAGVSVQNYYFGRLRVSIAQ
jgi:hypothetical protein